MNKQFKEYLITFRPTIQKNLQECISMRDIYLKEEPKEFHDEINQQFYDKMSEDVALELANNFPSATAEDIAMFMEDFDLKGWLK